MAATPQSLAVPEPEQALKQAGSALVHQANQLEILNAEQYAAAIEFGKGVVDLRKKIVVYFKPLKEATHGAHAAVCKREAEELDLPAQAEAITKRKVTEYRVAEQRRAEAAAQAERIRLQKEAEDRRIAEAQAAQAAGNTKLAEHLVSAPVLTPKVQVAAEVPKVAGVRKRTVWRFEVQDAGAVPREYLCVDETLVRLHINEFKDKAIIPGVRIWPEEKTDF